MTPKPTRPSLSAERESRVVEAQPSPAAAKPTATATATFSVRLDKDLVDQLHQQVRVLHAETAAKKGDIMAAFFGVALDHLDDIRARLSSS